MSSTIYKKKKKLILKNVNSVGGNFNHLRILWNVEMSSSDNQNTNDSPNGGMQVSRPPIFLRVITSELTNEVIFRINPVSTLNHLKLAYCTRAVFQVEFLRFMFRDRQIADYYDTPQSLGIFSFATIVVLFVCGVDCMCAYRQTNTDK